MKQMTTQKALNKLTAICPCEIRYIESNECWTKEEFYGCYVYNYESKLSTIEISNIRSKEQQLSTLAHEVGHAMCALQKCRCYRRRSCNGNSSQLSEYHAMLFGLRWLLGNRCSLPLELNICMIMENSSMYFNGDYRDVHSSSAIRIMETKLWQRCLAACSIKQMSEIVPAYN